MEECRYFVFIYTSNMLDIITSKQFFITQQIYMSRIENIFEDG